MGLPQVWPCTGLRGEGHAVFCKVQAWMELGVPSGGTEREAGLALGSPDRPSPQGGVQVDLRTSRRQRLPTSLLLVSGPVLGRVDLPTARGRVSRL